MTKNYWTKELPTAYYADRDVQLKNLITPWYQDDNAQALATNLFGGRDRGYTPTCIEYKLNEQGYRTDSFNKIDDGKLKVMTLGCSFTFGHANRLSEIWPTLVQQQIPNSQLINLGQVGSSPDYVVRTLYKAIHTIKPDIVFILWPFSQRQEAISEGEFDQPFTIGPFHKKYPDDYMHNNFLDYTLQKNKAFAHTLGDLAGIRIIDIDAPAWDTWNDWFESLGGDPKLHLGRDSHFGPAGHDDLAKKFIKLYSEGC